jgi:hypothetical protein
VPFWDYYVYAVWFALTTGVRMELMRQLERPVDVYGVFADQEPVPLLASHPFVRFHGHRHHERELPETFAAAKVNLCLCTGCFSVRFRPSSSSAWPRADSRSSITRTTW